MTHSCWADDTCLFAASTRQAAYQLRTLCAGVEPTGLLVRLETCKWAEFGRRPRDSRQPNEARRAKIEERRKGELDIMRELAGSTCMRVLGAQAQVDEGWRSETEFTQEKAWAAFHTRCQMWSARDSHDAKVRILHLSVAGHLVECGMPLLDQHRIGNAADIATIHDAPNPATLATRGKKTWASNLRRSTSECEGLGTRLVYPVGRWQQPRRGGDGWAKDHGA